MGDTIILRQGTLANLPDLQVGEPGWTTDTNQLYIGAGAGTSESAVPVGGYDYLPGAFTQASIAAALTAIGLSDKKTVLLRPGTWVISSNADWSAYTNVTFKIAPGAIISHGAYTLNIPNLDAGLYQVFSGTGAVTLSGNVKEVYPEWWGIDGTADQVQIQAAINSLPVAPNSPWFPTATVDATHAQTWAGTVKLSGFYSINAAITTVPGLRLRGQGRHTTQIYNANAATLDAIQVVGTRASQADYHVEISDMTITGNASSGNGIYLKNVMYPHFNHLIVQLHGQNGVMVKMNDATYAPGTQVGGLLENSEIYSNRRWGVLYGDTASDTDAGTIFKIHACSIRSNGADLSTTDPAGGVKYWNTIGPEMYANNIEGNYGVGLQISSVAGTYVNNYFESNDGGNKTITNITKANPAVVTYTESGYNYKNSQTISIFGVGGMTEVNNKSYTIANVNTTAHTFELVGINSSAYTTYTTGGTISGVNVLLTKEGIGTCSDNLLVGAYLAYGTMHLDDTAIENVIVGTYFPNGTDNPNLIVGATSLNNQFIGTRSGVPIRQDPALVTIYRNDKTEMRTATLYVDTVLQATGMRVATTDTYILGDDPAITGTGPKGFKSLILKDTTDGKHYKITVINGVVTATALD